MRRSRFVFRAAMFAAVLGLVACSSRRPHPTEVEKHPASIAIIPVLDLDEISLDRDNGWMLLIPPQAIFQIVDHFDLKERRREFATHFRTACKWIGPELTEAMRVAGERRGYRTVVLGDLRRDPQDPEDIDYPKIATDADIVIHVQVKALGLHSPRFTNDYLPKLEVGATIVARRSGATLVDEDFRYGGDENPRAGYRFVPSDPRYRFEDMADAITHVALVDESWHAGATALGARIIEQVGTPLR